MNTIIKINRKMSFFVILALLGASWLSFTVPVEATPNAVPSISTQFQTIPVERLLNPDGTLNLSAGGSGTLDLRGWQVTLDSKRGPLFQPASGPPANPATDVWSPLGTGMDSIVFAIAVSSSDVY